MSDGSKRFNIWIVYSDLFTNLATFLFISALGVFAAFGSGLFAEGGPGGEERCRALLEGTGSLVGGDSALVPIGSRVVSDDDRACARYYRMGDLQFRSIVPSIYHLKGGSQRAATRPDLIRKVCVPLWRTLEDPAFRQAGGAVTLVGLRVASDDYSYVERCSVVDKSYDPILAEPPVRRFPAGRRPIDVIHDCQDPRLGSANPLLCPDILECIEAGEAGEWCERVRAVELRGRQIAAACEQARAERQAKLIYDICESAPLEAHFDRWHDASERAQQGASPAKTGAARAKVAPMPEGERRKWWWHVGFDGLTRDWPTVGADGEEDEERNILVPDQGGTAVVVKVEFPR